MNIGCFFRGLASISLCVQALAGPPAASGAPPEKTIAVIGSSVAAGWVTAREASQDMKNGWAFRLARHLEPLGYKVVNVSVPGDTTEKVLARLNKDLLSLQPDFAVISLSLENEGIRGIGGRDPRKVYEGFGTNLRRIIAECRKRNIVPVIASCYANDNFGDPATYRFIVGMNLEMASWDVPVINFLGALDRGDGRFVKGPTFDLDHPADRGHRELFLSIVPGLFEALAAGKPAPERDAGLGCFSVGKGGQGGYLSCFPADPMHSFTSIFEIRASGPGIAAAIRRGDGKFAGLSVTESGEAVLHASTGEVQRISSALLDGKWHRVGLIYHHLKKELMLDVDGATSSPIPESILPVQFLLGGSGEESPEGSPAAAEYRDWMIYRVPLNGAEMEAIQAGRLLPASLEVFAPLRGGKSKVDSEVENRAQSTSRVVFMSKDIPREIARLETAIARQDREEIVYIDPNEKKPVFVAPEVLAAWKGVYEIAPGLVLTIVMEEDRLFLLVNGGDDGKTELFPLSVERFFVKSVGPQIEISFQAEKSGQPAALVFKVDGQEMKGTRKEIKTGQTLSENLKILEPLVNKHWVGEMKAPDGSRMFKTDRNFQVVWDGSVVKYTSSIPEIDSFSEGYFYWDRKAQKLAAFILSSRGVVQHGTVSVENGVVTVQGTMVFPEQTFDYKNTFEFTPDGKMIDRWFQNAFGPWRPGHVIEFIEQKAG